jgi:hypothetical protein
LEIHVFAERAAGAAAAALQAGLEFRAGKLPDFAGEFEIVILHASG